MIEPLKDLRPESLSRQFERVPFDHPGLSAKAGIELFILSDARRTRVVNNDGTGFIRPRHHGVGVRAPARLHLPPEQDARDY